MINWTHVTEKVCQPFLGM